MNKEILSDLINKNYTSRQIATELGKKQTTIRYWLNKFKLKTNHRSFNNGVVAYRIWNKGKTGPKNTSKEFWDNFQSFINEGHTWEECSNKFEISLGTMLRAKKAGLIKTNNKKLAQSISFKKGRRPKHTEETKNKISLARIKFLEANPDKVPYLINHSSKQSYPEKLFQDALIKENIIGWQYAYRAGIYEYDFAFPNLKLDIEIDGGTHNTEKVKKIDFRRDLWSESNGWKVLRFTSKQVKKDLPNCILKLKQFIGLEA